MKPSHLPERIGFAALWIALVGYWLFYSPPPPPDLLAQIGDLALARTTSVDPIAIAIFNLLGVLPTAFLGLLLHDTGRPRPLPFALGGYLLGGIALLPYLVLRDPRAALQRAPSPFLRIIGSRFVGAILLLLALGLIAFAMLAGDPGAFLHQAGASQLIAVMSADLVVLSLALHWTAASDRKRRGIALAGWTARAVRLPMVGPLLYLAVR
jgi:hypothetical protein